jgi:hypothetical protein
MCKEDFQWSDIFNLSLQASLARGETPDNESGKLTLHTVDLSGIDITYKYYVDL